jgi:HEAT repeat protein
VTSHPRFLKLFFLSAAPVCAASPNASTGSQRIQGVFSMWLTAPRDAVPIRIDLLQASDQEIRQVAAISLERLTHRAAPSDEVSGLDPAWPHKTWQTWWRSDSAAAPIYAHNECGETLRIDSSKPRVVHPPQTVQF